MQPIINYIKQPSSFFDSMVVNFGQWLPDSLYIKLRYRFNMGKKLHLRHPQTFQEKLQWLKLHDQNPRYTDLVDKIKVKEYVSKTVGEEYVVPLLGVWNNANDIDWDSLPNRFVLKTNHAGGNSGVVICRDKTKLDKQAVIHKLNGSLESDIYRLYREWPYKNVDKKIFAEAFIETRPCVKDLPDFKWYCFNGEPKFCQVIQDRITNETIDFYNKQWERQEFVGLNPAAGPAAGPAEKPKNLETQIRIARELSKDIPFARVDLYETGERTYFGEITFYPMSGLGVFKPGVYDELLGKMLVLPGEKRGGVIVRVGNDNRLFVSATDLPDYKFFCFNGKVKALFVASDRQTPNEEMKFDFFDEDFNHLPIRQGHPNSVQPPSKPKSFDEMKRIAESLSAGIPHVRVDFYEVNGRPCFGEMTFCHFAAMVPFEPEEWDYKFGEWLDLNNVYNR